MKKNYLKNIPKIRVSYSIELPPEKREQVTTSSQYFNIFWNYWNHDTISFREEVKMLLLDYNYYVLGLVDLGIGTNDACIVDISQLLGIALSANAKKIIVVHNHPSGIAAPSKGDIDCAKKLQKATETVKLDLDDFMIISPHKSYYSFFDWSEL